MLIMKEVFENSTFLNVCFVLFQGNIALCTNSDVKYSMLKRTIRLFFVSSNLQYVCVFPNVKKKST